MNSPFFRSSGAKLMAQGLRVREISPLHCGQVGGLALRWEWAPLPTSGENMEAFPPATVRARGNL